MLKQHENRGPRPQARAYLMEGSQVPPPRGYHFLVMLWKFNQRSNYLFYKFKEFGSTVS